VLYPIFAPLYPLSVAATPALYALGAAYFVALGRRAEIGSLFGALAIWGELALYMSVRASLPLFFDFLFMGYLLVLTREHVVLVVRPGRICVLGVCILPRRRADLAPSGSTAVPGGERLPGCRVSSL
jgi:hypothetical protein